MAERVRVREIDDDEGRRLLRTVRRGTGSVVTWRRAQMVLLSAQGMPVAKIARSAPAEHSLPFSTWSLAKLADFLVCEGVVDDISHEGLRILLREEGVSFQRVTTWKTSHDPDYAVKKARIEHLYALADGEIAAEPGEPEVVRCGDEFGPLNLQPHPGRHWVERGGRHKDPGRDPRPRRRATYTRPHGVRHLFAAYDLGKDKLYGHLKKTNHLASYSARLVAIPCPANPHVAAPRREPALSAHDVVAEAHNAAHDSTISAPTPCHRLRGAHGHRP
ncbi:hypothetical protein [Streptosporangium roseum]|uniref:hypothetical protein n=1 Tax=Streptosporangium roseum TaxID=2001 RepID=UPI001E612598|nr:hypothetical protein [Streptosporangium roseum]